MVRIPTNKWIAPLALVLFLVVQLTLPARAEEKITLAAAADLKYALDEVVVLFIRENPDARVETVYGSSGKFHAQIRQGAPYDLYFSADIAYPRALVEAGLAASEVQPYGIGRIVLWGTTRDAAKMTLMTLADLADPAVARIAMANPRHAPYGQRAEEALRSAGIWERVKPRLVFGENVAQSAQFVQTGLSEHGSYVLIPETLHRPLEQGFIITRRAAGKPLAQRFARFMKGTGARATMTRYGFVLPGEAK